MTYSSAIVGPAIFGFTFIQTVGTHPITIFWLSALCIFVSLFFICLVRLPRVGPGAHRHGDDSPLVQTPLVQDADDLESASVHPDRDATLVDTGTGADASLMLLDRPDGKGYDTMRGRNAHSRKGSPV